MFPLYLTLSAFSKDMLQGFLLADPSQTLFTWPQAYAICPFGYDFNLKPLICDIYQMGNPFDAPFLGSNFAPAGAVGKGGVPPALRVFGGMTSPSMKAGMQVQQPHGNMVGGWGEGHP